MRALTRCAPSRARLGGALAGAALVAAGAGSARPAAAAGRRQAAPPAVGHVVFVTDKRAYLDRGSVDGLEAKQSLDLSRGGRVATTCTVDSVDEHGATCVGGRPRPGDSFRTPGGQGARAAREPVRLPALIDDATLSSRAVAVAEARYDKVDFTGKPAFRAHTSVSVSPGFEVWPDPAGGYAVERIDGAILGVELGTTGMRFDGAFTAMRWQTPMGLGRFRPAQPTQFYLWEAEVSRRRVDGPTVFALGRLWPYHMPGLPVLDGFQLGRQNEAQTREGGVYAGLVPTALGLAFATDAWAGGLYGSLVQMGAARSSFRMAREVARLGAFHVPGVGVVAEAEGLALAWFGPINVAAGGHARLASAVSSTPVVDRATLDVGARPTLTLGGGLHVRYLGSALREDAPLAGVLATLAGSVHALADVHWDATSWLGVAAFAGAHRDGALPRGQSHAAVELRLPRLFGSVGGLWLGAESEEGWLRGRSAYLQLMGHVADRVRVTARASANATQFETPPESSNLHELGGYLHVDGDLTSSIRLRAWSLLRVPVLVQGERPPGGPPGLVLGSSLTGVF